MRRYLAVLGAATLAMSAGGCMATNQDVYEFGERCIGLGDYTSAADQFAQLGDYRDSMDYRLYAEALEALSEGKLALARINFEQVAPFKSSERYLQCLDAVELEQAGDLEGALAIYRTLGTFAACDIRVEELETEIPERERDDCRAMMEAGDYEGAASRLRAMEKSPETEALLNKCEAAMTQKAYEAACELYDDKKYKEAMAAFEELGDLLDAPARVAMCRSELYRSALGVEATVESMPELIATYELLGDYLDSAERHDALEKRYACLNALLTMPDAYVQLGEINGEALLWRVEHVADGEARLVAQRSFATEPVITWRPDERRAITQETHRKEVKAAASMNQTIFDSVDPETGVLHTLKPDGQRAAQQMEIRPVVHVSVHRLPLDTGDGSETSPFQATE